MSLWEEHLRTHWLTQVCSVLILIFLWTSTVASLSIFRPGYNSLKDSESPLELEIDLNIQRNHERDNIRLPISIEVQENDKSNDNQHNRQHIARQIAKQIARWRNQQLNMGKSFLSQNK